MKIDWQFIILCLIALILIISIGLIILNDAKIDLALCAKQNISCLSNRGI
jgi:hypothetical protein